jgi:hypothetical protein
MIKYGNEGNDRGSRDEVMHFMGERGSDGGMKGWRKGENKTTIFEMYKKNSLIE